MILKGNIMDTKKIVFVTSLLAFGMSAWAGLKETKLYKEADAELMKAVDHVNESCGIKLSATVDHKSFKTTDFEKQSVGGYCGNALSGLALVCEDADGKAAVKKLKKFNCKSGGTKREFKVTGDTFVFAVDFSAGNDESEAKKYLEENL